MKNDMTQAQEDILRAAELMNLAVRTEGVDREVACFIAARILRKEDIVLEVCSQGISCRDHMNRQPVSNEVYLLIGNTLVDGFGVYRHVEHLADASAKRLNMVKAQAFGQPRRFPSDETKEEEEIYTGWGHTSSDIAVMVDTLVIQDRAERLQRATPLALGETAQRRL
jgi:hypothetical protein